MHAYTLEAYTTFLPGEVEFKFHYQGRPQTAYWFTYHPQRHD